MNGWILCRKLCSSLQLATRHASCWWVGGWIPQRWRGAVFRSIVWKRWKNFSRFGQTPLLNNVYPVHFHFNDNVNWYWRKHKFLQFKASWKLTPSSASSSHYRRPDIHPFLDLTAGVHAWGWTRDVQVPGKSDWHSYWPILKKNNCIESK